MPAPEPLAGGEPARAQEGSWEAEGQEQSQRILERFQADMPLEKGTTGREVADFNPIIAHLMIGCLGHLKLLLRALKYAQRLDQQWVKQMQDLAMQLYEAAEKWPKR